MSIIFLYLVLVPWAACAGLLLGYLIGWALWWYELRVQEWRMRKLQKVADSWGEFGDRLEVMFFRVRALTDRAGRDFAQLCKAREP
jgi:hypothetical protein